MLTILLSKHMVRVVYGEGYALAPLYLSLATLGALGVGVGGYALGSLFAGLGMTREALRSWLVSTAVSLPLTLALVPALGVLGAMMAGLVGGYASIAYLLARAERAVGVSIGVPRVARVYAASLVSAFPTLAATAVMAHDALALAVGAAVYVVAYAVALPLLKAIDGKDVEVLTEVLRQVGPAAKPLVALLAVERRVVNLLSR
ncbi:polysaccharide biosynthesis C-terminal domain-containing protein [Thermoproteus tenax]|uniref:polysaccharide biosynthesis C-terminal domain-containing protein n=1 Tax=Thermoproteus tenax TaxID=2271 RepID=UPI0018D3CEC4|nr:polysaccharide biosynthesis C-terminal domain-containing protein [Thermoproteus tenax]